VGKPWCRFAPAPIPDFQAKVTGLLMVCDRFDQSIRKTLAIRFDRRSRAICAANVSANDPHRISPRVGPTKPTGSLHELGCG